MTNETNAYEVATEIAREVARDALESDGGFDLSDWIWSAVDGCAEVIYTHRARRIVDSLTSDDEAIAYDEWTDCGGTAEGAGNLAAMLTQIAYHALTRLVWRALEDGETLTGSGEPLRVVCVAHSAFGRFIPQYFAEAYGELIDDSDRAILESGPGHDLYWDVWADVLDSVDLHRGGLIFRLHTRECGDLFWTVSGIE